MLEAAEHGDGGALGSSLSIRRGEASSERAGAAATEGGFPVALRGEGAKAGASDGAQGRATLPGARAAAAA